MAVQYVSSVPAVSVAANTTAPRTAAAKRRQ